MSDFWFLVSYMTALGAILYAVEKWEVHRDRKQKLSGCAKRRNSCHCHYACGNRCLFNYDTGGEPL